VTTRRYYHITLERTGRAITCHHCGMTSRNDNDVEQRYCASCHIFLEDDSHCDFCLAEGELPGNYTAKCGMSGELLNGQMFVDSGSWGACPDCKKLIDAKRWNDLADAAVAGNLANNPNLIHRGEALKFRFLYMIHAIFEGEVRCAKCDGNHPTAMHLGEL
jgi:hypothetical protein